MSWSSSHHLHAGKNVRVIPSLPSHLIIPFRFQLSFSNGEVIQMWLARLMESLRETSHTELVNLYSVYSRMKVTVENPRGSVKKLSSKESVEGADTVLRGSVRAPEVLSKGKPEAEKPRGRRPPEVLQPRVCPRKIPRDPSHCPAAQCCHPRHIFLRG